MDNINYNEKVIIPFLEKKCKDLLSMNLVLEGKLLIEQNKLKDIESEKGAENNIIDQLRSDISAKDETIIKLQNSKNTIETERNNLLVTVSSLESQYKREEALKNNAIGEYQILNDKYLKLLEKVQLLENEIKKKSVKKVVAETT